MGLMNDDPKTYVGLRELTLRGNSSQRTYFTVEEKNEERFNDRNVAPVTSEKTGKTRHYRCYQKLGGKITGVAYLEREWDNGKGGKVKTPYLNVTITDEGTDYILQLHWLSNAADDFKKRLERVDFNEPVVLKAGTYNERMSVGIIQNSTYIKPVYTAANPGDKPAWVEGTFNGKKMYDRTDETNYFRGMLEGKIKNAINAVNQQTDAASPVNEENESVDTNEDFESWLAENTAGHEQAQPAPIPADEMDDLPF